MSLLPIRIFPDPILRASTELVTDFDDTLHSILDDMRETMYAEDGIGLAAPQVGIAKQIAVIDISRDGTGYMELINPKIQLSREQITSEEGCLSIPGYREKIMRSKEVEVTALDRKGNPFSFTAEGLLSFCAQHEIDHLNGKLFIDYLSGLKKSLFQAWLKKQSE